MEQITVSTKQDLAIGSVEPNHFNPNVMPPEAFALLLEDMKKTGQQYYGLTVDPIKVAPSNVFYNDPEEPEGKYTIIDGEHRWRAAKELGWKTIACEVVHVSEEIGRIINYRKNKERGNMDPLKEAKLFQQEVDSGLTQDRIALAFNVSQQYIASRLALLKLDEKVINFYRDPDQTFKETMLNKHQQQVDQYQQAKEEAEQKGRPYYSIGVPEPEELEEVDLTPRGVMSPSHLEAISSLPKDMQPAAAERILERDMTVRETEDLVKNTKRKLAQIRRFKAAFEKAKRPNCPTCGTPAVDFGYNDESRFRCETTSCYEKWDYNKTAEQARKELKEQQKRRGERRAEKVREQFKEARENPSYIRMLQTPQELHELIKPWLLKQVQQLTQIGNVTIEGKRGDETVNLFYQNPDSWRHMDLSLIVRKDGKDKRFGFNVEAKVYKKFKDKSRVEIRGMKVNEEAREQLRRFFAETVYTKLDPWENATCHKV